MRLRYISLIILLSITSCVERIEVPVIAARETLVVDGLITNGSGPHTVRLFYSGALDAILGKPKPHCDAVVHIIENNSVHYELGETEPGLYETPPNFSGVIGNTYQLIIETEDGKKYESVPSVMKDAGIVNEVFAEFKENSINRYDLTQPQDAFFLYVNATGGESGVKNLLRWRWKATYQVHTTPEKRVRFTSTGPISDPPECSGCFFSEEGPPQCVLPCTCCDCWVTFNYEGVALSNPSVNSGSTFSKIYVGVIPVKNTYFYDKLLIRLDQLSVSEEVYSFWNLVKSQQEGAENIFQPDVVNVSGNIFSTTHPEEEVFGIFSVSGASEARLELRLEDIPKQITAHEIINDDCRYSGGTNIRPAFY
jgi:hypothetical protein